MIKKFSGFLVSTLIILMMLSGCGASTSTSNSAAPMADANHSVVASQYGSAISKDTGSMQFSKEVPAGDMVVTGSESVKLGEAKAKGNGQTAIVATGVENQPLVNAILAQRKIVRNANVSILVDNYEKTYGKIQSMVENSGIGYIQQSSVTKQGVYGKSGMIVVRVEADKFSQILNSVKGLGEVIDANESTEDITEKFYDTESELRLLKYEQSRLEEYLKKITDPDIIFKTESRLTEIRHQIESLTGTLNKLSDLVKLSTITINITEKGVDTNNKLKEKTYTEKLFGGFSDSLKGVGNFFGELILLLVSLLPVLMILVFVAWIIWIFYKKNQKGKNQKSESKKIDEN